MTKSDLAPLTETRLTELLDERGDHDTARRPGCYVLLLQHPPDDPGDVARQWDDHSDVLPPNGFCERLASADRLLYVGSHAQNMYERMAEHCRGEKSSTIMAVWPPVDVWAVYPDRDPGTDEYATAAGLANAERVVTWQDGTLRG